MSSTSSSLVPSRLRTLLNDFGRDQRGASFVEYVIVVGLVAIVCIMAFSKFGSAINSKVTTQTEAITKMK